MKQLKALRARSERPSSKWLFALTAILSLALAGMPTTADASPFAIRVGVSGSSGGGGGFGGGPGWGGAGGFGSVGGVPTTSLYGLPTPVSRSTPQRVIPTRSRVDGADGVDGGVNGALLFGHYSSPRPLPNTSPFVSTALSQAVGTVLSTLSVPGAPETPLAGSPSPSAPGGSVGSVALLDLGSGDYLAVSAPVALAPSGGTPISLSGSTTVGASNNVGGSASVAPASTIPGSDLGVAISNVGTVGTDLITYPGTGLAGYVESGTSLLTESTGVPNPEPASLFLLGTGLLIAVRRFGRRR